MNAKQRYLQWTIIFAYFTVISLVFLPLLVGYKLILETVADSVLIVSNLLLATYAFRKFEAEVSHE
jgi:hypothetical protein